MMRMLAVFAVGIMAVAAAACDGATTLEPAPGSAAAGAAEHWVDERFYDMDGYIYRFACDTEGNYLEQGGEEIRMHGGIYSRFAAVTTPTGLTTVTYHTMPVGLGGVGVDTGEPFRAQEGEHGNSTLSDHHAVNPWRFRMTLTGRDTGRRMTIMLSAHTTIVDGVVRVERFSESYECRAATRS